MMKNYRIRKVSDGFSTSYYPQEKWIGLFWKNMFGYDDYWDGSFRTFEDAQKYLCDSLKKPVVEYLDFDCGEN